ncbi:MAG TPA: hypothetical protein VGP07_03315 [Polyangia bacterium]
MRKEIVRGTSILLGVFLAVGAGCAHHETGPAYPGRPRGEWVKLGERSVDGARDRDVITVGAREGTYRRIMIVVERSPLEMFDVVVTFGDGTQFAPKTRAIFNPETRSHVIDLPGNRRVIRNVEFHYGNLPGAGRALAELWAD